MKKSQWLAAPHLIWMAIFIIIPLFLVFYYAFFTRGDDGSISFTLRYMAQVFAREENSQGKQVYLYLNVILNSLRLAGISTLICLVIGYPVALILSSKEFSNRGNLLFLFAVPMWMNFLLRTYSWLPLLEPNGFLNTFLANVGLPKIDILYTETAVLLGMVYNFLPFMILPIHTILSKLDYSIIEAAQDLGANPVKVFTKVTLPLSIPGVISGITMVFMPAVTAFIVPKLLGSSDTVLIGTLIEKQFTELYDWQFGSALSIILMVVILLSMAIISLVDRRSNDGEGVVL